MAIPNPYQPSEAVAETDADSPVSVEADFPGLTQSDLRVLRRDSTAAASKFRSFDILVIAILCLAFSGYCFSLAADHAANGGTDIGTVIQNDVLNYPDDFYSGHFVRSLDELMSGVLTLLASVACVFLFVAQRRSTSFNARVHTALVKAGVLIPKDSGKDATS